VDAIERYLHVTKPGILLANLVSAVGGFLLASRGRIDPGLFLATLIGIGLVIASGCVFNNCIDRDVDQKMTRTRNRVLARGEMPVPVAVCYASVLGISGTALLWITANGMSLVIVLAGFGIYVGAYSLFLKRRSVYATAIGSLAGAAPPLAAYCAVSNRFDLGALILLAIFSLWQIPHSYAIAVFRIEDYTATAIPVLPVKRGIPCAKTHIRWHVLAFWAATLLLTPAGYTGPAYFAVAAVTGLGWLALAWWGRVTTDDRRWAKALVIFSIVNITVVSLMMGVDVTRPAASHLFTYLVS
jgi:heme o synthase